jgi:2-polyprenyl-3-methyl-5-hydroxy-6-metoxy-1,4-benzoquinol methylase
MSTEEWEAIHQSRHWGTYPDIHVVRQVKKFMAQWSQQADTLVRPRALDIGCGVGAQAKMMHQDGMCVLAIDASPTAIERLGMKNAFLPGFRAECADIVGYAPDSQFDFILDNLSLTYLEHPPWERILSWLKPNGWLIHASFEQPPKGTPRAWEHKEPGHVVERHTSWVEGNAYALVVRKYVKPSER